MSLLAQLIGLLLVTIGVFAPLALWFERRRAGGILERLGGNPGELAGWRTLTLFFPAALVDGLSAGDTALRRPFSRLAPALAFASMVLLLAIIPVGSRYRFGGLSLQLTIAPLSWGLIYFFFVACLAAYAYALRYAKAREDAVAAATAALSFLVAITAVWAGPLLVYGTQNLAEIPGAQDRVVPALAWLAALGWSGGASAGWLLLPAWGVFVQPLAFVLFLVCAFALCPRPQAETALSADDEPPCLALWMAADLLRAAVAGALVTVFFLGGWSIPYASQAAITAWFSDLGPNVASLVCLLLHVLSFIAKVSLFLLLYSTPRFAVPRLNNRQAMTLCWKLVIPLAAANVALTSLVLLALERNP